MLGLRRRAAVEIAADGTDQDCDGLELCHLDIDGDGSGVADTIPSRNLVCTGPGEAADAEDCDDTSVGVHPGAVELCNGVDDDCDLAVDEDGGCGSTADTGSPPTGHTGGGTGGGTGAGDADTDTDADRRGRGAAEGLGRVRLVLTGGVARQRRGWGDRWQRDGGRARHGP